MGCLNLDIPFFCVIFLRKSLLINYLLVYLQLKENCYDKYIHNKINLSTQTRGGDFLHL